MANGTRRPARRGRARWYDALVGEVLDGRYELLAPVGHGGMGAVFRAQDRRMKRVVAVKVMNPELVEDDPRAPERFRAEALLVAGLGAHPCLVEVFDTNDADDQTGLCYIAMQFVAGQTLDKVLTAGPLTVERAVRVVGDVLSALAHAHAVGVVHRDVKPGNVMVTDGGQVKVVDFGIARAVDATVTTKIRGTPEYMAPEQALNRPVNARTDLYAAGCLLFAVLTGGPPFVGDNAVAVALQHVNQPPPRPTDLRPDLPAGVDAVVAKALAKEPDDRYQTAEEFRDALGALVGGRPGLAQRQPSDHGATSVPPPSFPPAVHDGRTVKVAAPGLAKAHGKPAGPTTPLVVAPAEKVPARPEPQYPSRPLRPESQEDQARAVAYPPPPAHPIVPKISRSTPGPVERLGRLDGLVDYQARVPSSAEDVAEACRKVAGMTRPADRHLVRLSGIDWRVLEVRPEEHRALLLADRVIGTRQYHRSKGAVTWERCDLRRWLNQIFTRSLGEPLTSRALRQAVRNESNPAWGTGGGEDTIDQFFLLSIKEAVRHLAGGNPDELVERYRFEFIKLDDGGMAKNEEGKSSGWWLRTPGRAQDGNTHVSPGGILYDDVSSTLVPSVTSFSGVRPAFWLNLES